MPSIRRPLAARVPATLLAATLLVAPVVVRADSYNKHCSDGQHVRWTNNTQEYSRPDTWATSYKDAITRSAANMTNNTSSNWYMDNLDGSTGWAGLNDSANWDIAGVAQLYYNDSTCRIYSASLYFNFAHFSQAYHTTDQKQCTAIHEFGHAAGVWENSTTSVSVMNRDHYTRCHNNTWKNLFQVDIDKLNALY